MCIRVVEIVLDDFYGYGTCRIVCLKAVNFIAVRKKGFTTTGI